MVANVSKLIVVSMTLSSQSARLVYTCTAIAAAATFIVFISIQAFTPTLPFPLSAVKTEDCPVLSKAKQH